MCKWIWIKLKPKLPQLHKIVIKKKLNQLAAVIKEIKMAKADGKEFKFLDETNVNPSFLEVFDFNSPEQYIKTETKEFSAVCPFSGLPDLANVIMRVLPPW